MGIRHISRKLEGKVLSSCVTPAWRKVEGVMRIRHISRKLKGKVLSSCVTPAYLYSLETMAMTEKQQEKLHVCLSNWVRRIDKRRLEELREEVGVRENITRDLARSRLKWTGHVERMEGYGCHALRMEGIEGEN